MNIFGAEFRRVENREFEGKPAVVVVAARSFDTTVEDLWEAISTRERLQRWFLPVEGELKVGGRYQLVGNAAGTITRCDPPEALDVTWEFGGGMSWVNVRLAAEDAGQRARLTLEHIAHRDGIGEEHLQQYGPGAGGVGWDLAFHGLGKHFENPDLALDPAAFEAWAGSEEGKQFMRACAEAWGEADAASGTDPAEAKARAERTHAFYTGGE